MTVAQADSNLSCPPAGWRIDGRALVGAQIVSGPTSARPVGVILEAVVSVQALPGSLVSHQRPRRKPVQPRNGSTLTCCI